MCGLRSHYIIVQCKCSITNQHCLSFYTQPSVFVMSIKGRYQSSAQYYYKIVLERGVASEQHLKEDLLTTFQNKLYQLCCNRRIKIKAVIFVSLGRQSFVVESIHSLETGNISKKVEVHFHLGASAQISPFHFFLASIILLP